MNGRAAPHQTLSPGGSPKYGVPTTPAAPASGTAFSASAVVAATRQPKSTSGSMEFRWRQRLVSFFDDPQPGVPDVDQRHATTMIREAWGTTVSAQEPDESLAHQPWYHGCVCD